MVTVAGPLGAKNVTGAPLKLKSGLILPALPPHTTPAGSFVVAESVSIWPPETAARLMEAETVIFVAPLASRCRPRQAHKVRMAIATVLWSSADFFIGNFSLTGK
jgi:hypothetical protein